MKHGKMNHLRPTKLKQVNKTRYVRFCCQKCWVFSFIWILYDANFCLFSELAWRTTIHWGWCQHFHCYKPTTIILFSKIFIQQIWRNNFEPIQGVSKKIDCPANFFLELHIKLFSIYSIRRKRFVNYFSNRKLPFFWIKM